MNHPARRADKPQGQYLKEVRESKGIALERVHEITKIPLDVLRAIEEGYTVRTLSNFYFRAFMKKYAQFLGVEVTEVIDDYQTEKLPEPLNPQDEPAGSEFNLEQILPKEKQQLVVKIAAVLVILFVVFKIGGCVKQSFSRPKKVKKIVRVKKAETKNTEDTKAKTETQAEKIALLKKSKPVETPPQQSSGAVETKPAAPAAPAITKPVSMTVKARDKVWLQVKVDGNVVYQSSMNKGVVETWQADDRIEISGRNISDLEFEVNGKTLGQLGRADRQARRIIVTKDGMTVKK